MLWARCQAHPGHQWDTQASLWHSLTLGSAPVASFWRAVQAEALGTVQVARGRDA